ncbi:MAG: cytochrome c biogenesis protein ResB, partial [Bacteroidaceae bacterium]|nr:cytochrome c biogenesis protein ResB [Bacteroidaceae bacterium]
MKKTVTVLYIVVIAVMAVATMIEKKQGTSYVSDHIYGVWWFSALWALLTGFAIFYFIKRKVRRPSVVALHLSFVVILAGALLTHLTAERGIVLLRKGQVATHYLTPDLQEHQLPFTISLQAFEILYHEGTQAPADYISHVLIDQQPFTISMNQIANHKGIRLYQNNYDEDMQSSVLSLNSDPWGIPVTYSGYALLFISLIWMLIDPRGAYRQLLRRLSILVLLCSACGMANATPRTLPAETADRFGQLFVVYNERVCPMQTYALDFTKKLYGKRHYQDFTAEQVLTGFIFFYDDWIQEPLKQDTKPMKMEEKRMLIQQLHQGTPLKLFPYADQGKITWYAPTSTLPDTMDEEHQKYIRDVFTLLNGEIQAGRYDLANAYLDKMLQYQQTFGQRSLPTPLQVRAERLQQPSLDSHPARHPPPMDHHRPLPPQQRLRNHARPRVARRPALHPPLSALTIPRSPRHPSGHHLPPGQPHLPDGSPDDPPYARAQLTPPHPPRLRHHDGLRPPLPHLHQLAHRPLHALKTSGDTPALPAHALPCPHLPGHRHLHRSHLGQHL